MSPINSALQYKIQKMEKQLSSLMEENTMLRLIIKEAAPSPTLTAGPGGGGQFSGQQLGNLLAQGGNAYQGYLGQFGSPPSAMNQTGGSNTATSMARSSRGAAPDMRSAVAPAGGVGAGQFDGAQLGSLLAQAGQDGGAAANAYLNQFGYGLTPLSVGGAQSATNQRRTNPLATRR